MLKRYTLFIVLLLGTTLLTPAAHAQNPTPRPADDLLPAGQPTPTFGLQPDSGSQPTATRSAPPIASPTRFIPPTPRLLLPSRDHSRFIPFVSEDEAVTFNYPPEWAVKEDGTVYILATDPALFERLDAADPPQLAMNEFAILFFLLPSEILEWLGMESLATDMDSAGFLAEFLLADMVQSSTDNEISIGDVRYLLHTASPSTFVSIQMSSPEFSGQIIIFEFDEAICLAVALGAPNYPAEFDAITFDILASLRFDGDPDDLW